MAGTMSEQSTSHILSNNKSNSNSGNVFSQLRHLASDVESGIEILQQHIDSGKITSDRNTSHTQAINFLLHTKKDIAHLKREAEVKAVEFSKGNEKMSRVCELMEYVVAAQSHRLENVESYLEQYGYRRLGVRAVEKQSSNAVEVSNVVEKFDRNNYEDDKSDVDNDYASSNSDVNDCDASESPKTQTPEKHFKPSFIRTPRLEDLFKDLSEQSIHLLKQGMKQRPEDETALKQNIAVKENTYSGSRTNKALSSSLSETDQTGSTTPEPPTLSTSKFASKSYDKICEQFRLNSEQLVISRFDSCLNKSPEVPQLRTQHFQLNNASKVAHPGQNYINPSVDNSKSNCTITDKPRTPEPPEILTRLFTLHDYTGRFETSKASVVVAPTSPETPTLLTPGFKLNRFSNKNEPEYDSGPQMLPVVMKTPEAPTLLLSKFEPSISSINPTNRDGRTARSLFNTPPMPELKSRTDFGNDFSPGKENFKAAVYLPEPKAPKLLSRNPDLKAHFGFRGTNCKK